uniref:Pheromone binding protein 7 n=1 Tax=Odontomachus monticola TaxID=613454 RepID=A0A348G659_ODOMO
MKQTLLLLLTLVVSTMSFNEDFLHITSKYLNLTTDAVMTCINMTSITYEDLMHLDVIEEENLQTDNTALKVGCMFSCFMQTKELMINAHIDTNKMKEVTSSKCKSPEEVALRFQILDTCSERVRNMTNECKVSLNFILCLMNEVQRLLGE